MTANATLRRARGFPVRAGWMAILGLMLIAGLAILSNPGTETSGVSAQATADISVAQEDFSGVDDFVAARVQSAVGETPYLEDFSGVDDFVAARVQSAVGESLYQEDFSGLD